MFAIARPAFGCAFQVGAGACVRPNADRRLRRDSCQNNKTKQYKNKKERKKNKKRKEPVFSRLFFDGRSWTSCASDLTALLLSMGSGRSAFSERFFRMLQALEELRKAVSDITCQKAPAAHFFRGQVSCQGVENDAV